TAIAEQRRSDHVTRRIVQVARTTFMILLLAATLVIGLRNDVPGQAMTYGLACLASLVVSPLAWGHYYVMPLPAALFGPLWLVRRGYPIAARAVAVGLPVWCWTHYVFMPWIGPIGLLGLGTAFWFVSVCIAALLVRDLSPRIAASLSMSVRADRDHDLIVGS